MNEPQTPYYPPAPPTNTLAIISLVSGLVSWLLLPVLAAIVAVITGHMARSEIKNSQGAQGGDALAVVGLILGYLHLVTACALPLLVVSGIISVGGILSLCAFLAEPASVVTSFLQFFQFLQ